MLLRMLLQTLSTGSSFAASCERLLQESAFAGEEGAVEEDRTRLRVPRGGMRSPALELT